MSSSETAAALVEYMSKKALDVAQLNTVLGQFGSTTPLPASGTSVSFANAERLTIASAPAPDGNSASYKFTFRAVPISSSWIRVRYVDDVSDDWNTNLGCAGFDYGSEAAPLEIRELSASDREALERLLPF